MGEIFGFALSLHSLKWNLWRNFIRLCLPGRAVMWERASLLPPSAASSSRTLSAAPFKAQNMALNSFATPEGLEIGRAQAVQAEAAGVPCHTDMNPLLLKPQSDHTSQVVLNGRPIGNRNAYDYFRKEGRDELRREVCAAYDRLAARYNPVVLEGAGSISEINLRDTDLVNLPMALHAGADVILVGDIDRGGVFASVYGSLMLLRPHERERIKGILINKFRGDIRLFESGITMLEELCGIPVVGGALLP